MGVQNSRIEYINSANRTSGTNTDFYYHFSSWSQQEEYDSVCVLYSNIPISYYLINEGQNTFTLWEGLTSINVTIPPGNYSTTSFAYTLTQLLNGATQNALTYTITFPNSYKMSDTGKYTYSVNTKTIVVAFQFTDFLASVMGFDFNKNYVFISNGVDASTLTSSNVVNLIPENTLYLYSDIIETKDNNTENILQEFYSSNSQPYSNIVYQCTAPELYTKQMNKKKSNYFHFTLLNEYYQNLNLNGQPWFMTLCFYKRDNISSIVKNYIKLKVKNM